MAEENKENKTPKGENAEGQKGGEGQGENSDQRSDRTKERIEDLTGKLESTSKERDAERKKREELEFDLGFERVKSKYPTADEYREAVKKAAKSGIAVEDALIVELHKAGKLQTGSQKRETVERDAVGGSADTRGIENSSGSKSMGEMTHDERRALISELERKGELRLTP